VLDGGKSDKCCATRPFAGSTFVQMEVIVARPRAARPFVSQLTAIASGSIYADEQ
jgi:hypothetical protein